MRMRFPCFAAVLAMSSIACGPADNADTASAADDGGKPKITNQDQLPRHTYEVEASASEILTSEDAFAPLAAAVRSDIESLLADYEIEDRATLESLEGTLLNLDMLAGDLPSAERRIERMRAMQEKPSSRLTTGLVGSAAIAAAREPESAGLDRRQEAFEEAYRAAIADLPWDVVQDDIEQTKGNYEIYSKNLFLGLAESQIQPAIEAQGSVSGDIAQQLIGIRAFTEVYLPYKDQVVEVLGEYVEANDEEKPDIWASRAVDLSGESEEEIAPVVVAIWDSGTDAPIFGDRMFRNPAEVVNGEDDDGNGFVDDVHGIAWDLQSYRTTGDLLPLDAETQARVPELKANLKGILDLQANVQSPEASALRQRMASMEKDEVGPFLEDLNLYSAYAHGTHVAGIVAHDNPAVRLMIVRMTFDHRLIPDPPTIEEARRSAEAAQATVDYMKAHGVRVANMSWGGGQRGIEAALEVNGIGETAEERQKLAREIFSIGRDGLKSAIESAPEILFVPAAGNADEDAEFAEDMPASFELPNVLTAAAVDRAGDETGFTSFGPSVDVHANGFEVVSYIPGGETMPLSGTSMSAPNVVNLAAKLLALDPSLTTAELRALILDGADRMEDDRRVLLNPKRSVELLRERRAS
jgi:subtilisin family serine protease